MTPSAVVLGEQLLNGGFESPVGANNAISFPSTNTPNFGWRTTDTCVCVEVWRGTVSGVTAHTGLQFAEMNAFQAGTLYQVTSLEVCEDRVQWYDVATGDAILTSTLVPC